MRGLLSIGATLAVGFAIWLWGFGGAEQIMRWAVAAQAETQNAMAELLQRLRTGDRAALWGLWGLCFAYGFFHAAGPGHGKILIGGYGVGAQVAFARLSVLAVLSSLAQAVTAILLVYTGVFLLGLTQSQMTETADRWLAPASYGAIALVGLWLAWRGLRRLRRKRQVLPSHDHHHHDEHHHHAEDGTCSSCGHKHGPTPEEAAQVTSLRDAVAIIAAVAMRPCTGALFLLILTARFGLDWAGIIGALAMGLGTASVTVAVALAAVSFREGALRRILPGQGMSIAVPMIEMAVGIVIAVLSLQLMMGVL